MLEGVWLVHPEEAMCAAFQDRFAGLPGVRVVRGRLEDLEPHDCFVTAGNAFGLMTAGVDAAVVRLLGEEVMRRVQRQTAGQAHGASRHSPVPAASANRPARPQGGGKNRV
jgi:hypothetical protein